MRVEALIIGRGIAGTALARTLEEEGRSFLIIDQPRLNSASRVAGGLYNPIVFRTNKKTWLADDLFPFSRNFWARMEEDLKSKFVYDTRFVKILSSTGELNDWMSRSAEPGYSKFISSEIIQDKISSFDTKQGLGVVKEAGYVRINEMLDKHREKLLNNHMLREDFFSEKQLNIAEDKVYYKGVEADCLIDCRGCGTSESNLFDWLPVRPMKGELLTIHAPDLKLDDVLNKGFFILPQVEKDIYKVGATYAPKDLSSEITPAARQELIEKLEGVINVSYTVINQTGGLRPTSRDRKPMLGPHPEHNNIYCLNGLGSKGVTLAPFFARMLTKSIFAQGELMNEVDIKRFYKFYTHEKN